jgi:catechol 2,3-dioxygenase-like lactoylglutathione lyase family enzyme
MTVQRLEHIGIVVDDLAAATAFFAALGLELEGEASVQGGSVDRVNGLEGVRADIVMLRTRTATARSSWPSTARPHTRATTGRRRPTPQASATSFSS